MVEQVSMVLQELGVDGVRVHAEHFTAASTGEPGAGAPAAPTQPRCRRARTGRARKTVLMDSTGARSPENGR
jgi:hypothetical protein